jgi:hypothetical protein
MDSHPLSLYQSSEKNLFDRSKKKDKLGYKFFGIGPWDANRCVDLDFSYPIIGRLTVAEIHNTAHLFTI